MKIISFTVKMPVGPQSSSMDGEGEVADDAGNGDIFKMLYCEWLCWQGKLNESQSIVKRAFFTFPLIGLRNTGERPTERVSFFLVHDPAAYSNLFFRSLQNDWGKMPSCWRRPTTMPGRPQSSHRGTRADLRIC